MPIAERADNRDALLAAVVTVAAAAPLTGAVAMLVAGAPVAWLWLAVCASATVPPVVWFAARGRLFEPLPILLAVAALMFVARPLQLFLSWESLYSYLLTQDPVQTLTLLEAQELALYVTERLQDPLDAALGRAQGACALFLVALLAGYWLAGRAPLRNGLASLTGPSAFNQRAAIGVSLVIGLAAQTALIVRAGGPVAALEGAVAQTASSDSFVLFVLAGFSTAALVIWVAWRRPRRRLEQLLLAVSIGTVSTLWILTGSRARVFVTLLALVVIVNYLWRRWRMRELLVCGLLLLVFASSVVVLRTVAGEENLSEGVSASADHLLDERVILNDLTAFDNVLVATAIYGRERPHENGGFLVDAVRSYVPRRIDAGKPEGGDILFRRVIWGERFIAGRPPSAVGDFFIDFGLWGVALGALLLGAVCRFLLALTDPRPTGREYRVALFALLMVVLYEFLVGTLSIAIGFGLTLVLPFLVAAQVLGRLPGGRPATVETRG